MSAVAVGFCIVFYFTHCGFTLKCLHHRTVLGMIFQSTTKAFHAALFDFFRQINSTKKLRNANLWYLFTKASNIHFLLIGRLFSWLINSLFCLKNVRGRQQSGHVNFNFSENRLRMILNYHPALPTRTTHTHIFCGKSSVLRTDIPLLEKERI